MGRWRDNEEIDQAILDVCRESIELGVYPSRVVIQQATGINSNRIVLRRRKMIKDGRLMIPQRMWPRSRSLQKVLEETTNGR